MSGGITTSGGAGGVTANYADMTTAADGLDSVAGVVLDRSAQIAAVMTNGDLIASAVLSPGTAAAVADHVARSTVGPHGLAPTAVRLKASALVLRASVQAYQILDAAQAAAVDIGQDVGAPLMIFGFVESVVGRGLFDVATLNLNDLRNLPGAAGNDFMDMLYANPWLVNGVIEDAPGLMRAVSTVIGPGGTALISAWTMRTEGTPFPPMNLEQGTGDIIAMAGVFGLFRKGSPGMSVVGPTGPDGRSLGTPPLPGETLPKNLSSTMTGVAELSSQGNEGTIRVFEVQKPGQPVRWVVEIPGTQEWGPTAGKNPVDLTNNLRLMAGQQTEQNEAIRKAMRDAGVAPGQPVMLAGHSQGGITAASLASDPATRKEFDITNVYTGGSPISHFDIPDDVQVLSIEHTRDAVPRLDGDPNPDSPNWLTVSHDADGDVTRDGTPVSDTGATHGSNVYAKTAAQVDQSTDPAVTSTRDTFDPFMADGTSTVTEHKYALTRTLP